MKKRPGLAHLFKKLTKLLMPFELRASGLFYKVPVIVYNNSGLGSCLEMMATEISCHRLQILRFPTQD